MRKMIFNTTYLKVFKYIIINNNNNNNNNNNDDDDDDEDADNK